MNKNCRKNRKTALCMIPMVFLLFLLTGALCASTFTVYDVNNDGTISVNDVTSLLDYLAVLPENEVGESNAVYDCDFNGSLDVGDVTRLLDHLAKMVSPEDCAHRFGEEVTVLAPTCTKPGKARILCPYCNLVEYTGIEPNGHTIVIVEGYDPTCTETGLTDGSYCSVCREVLSYQEEIPAMGHSVVHDPGYPATCTEPGLTDGAHCDECGIVLIPQKPIPAAGHTYRNGVCINCTSALCSYKLTVGNAEALPGGVAYAEIFLQAEDLEDEFYLRDWQIAFEGLSMSGEEDFYAYVSGGTAYSIEDLNANEAMNTCDYGENCGTSEELHAPDGFLIARIGFIVPEDLQPGDEIPLKISGVPVLSFETAPDCDVLNVADYDNAIVFVEGVIRIIDG